LNNTIAFNNIPGIWKIGDSLVAPPMSANVEYDIAILDMAGTKYTKWRKIVTDMGDLCYEFYRPDIDEWIRAFKIPF
jgi:hypothetical protein